LVPPAGLPSEIGDGCAPLDLEDGRASRYGRQEDDAAPVGARGPGRERTGARSLERRNCHAQNGLRRAIGAHEAEEQRFRFGQVEVHRTVEALLWRACVEEAGVP